MSIDWDRVLVVGVDFGTFRAAPRWCVSKTSELGSAV
jgi:hypothetical protein